MLNDMLIYIQPIKISNLLFYIYDFFLSFKIILTCDLLFLKKGFLMLVEHFERYCERVNSITLIFIFTIYPSAYAHFPLHFRLIHSLGVELIYEDLLASFFLLLLLFLLPPKDRMDQNLSLKEDLDLQ